MEKSNLYFIKYPHSVLLRFKKRNVYARRNSVSNERIVLSRGKLSESQFLSNSAKMSKPAKNPFDLLVDQIRNASAKRSAAIGNGRQPAATAVLALARRENRVATMSPSP